MSEESCLKDILRLEDVLDSRSWEEKLCSGWVAAAPLCRAVVTPDQDWDRIQHEAEILFASAESCIEKAFALQWCVIAAEVRFDLRARMAWMRKWDECLGWSTIAYCRILRAYQEGLTYYFKGALRESEARFKVAHELSVVSNYPRGVQRSLFHLGLVQRDLGYPEAAIAFFERSLAIAERRNALPYAQRIRVQLERLGAAKTNADEEFRIDRAKVIIERFIVEGNLSAARDWVIRAERFRRRKGTGRKGDALSAYLALIAFADPKRREFSIRRMVRVPDPILKIRILELKKKAFGECGADADELAALQDLYGVARVIQRPFGNVSETRICGIALKEIPSPEIRKLGELLLSGGEFGKAELCEALWGYQYDPWVHDRRIYNLIYKTRSFFKKTDLIVNGYGTYRLNPKYCPAGAALTGKSA